MNRILILSLVLVSVVAAILLSTREPAIPVDVVAVQKGPISQYVDEQGKTRLPRTILISMPFDGRLNEINLEEGDPVDKDQLVAQIVQADVEAEYTEAKAAVERLAASIRETADKTVERTSKQQAEYFVKSMISTVEAARARMQASRSRYDYSVTYLDRVQKLFERGANTEDELDRAQVQRVEGETEYQTDVLTYQAILSIDAATRLLPNLITQYMDRKDLSVAVLEQQKVEAEARLRTAKLRFDRSTMHSPVSGVILKKSVTNEQSITAGTELLEIGQLETLEVEAEILSQDATTIRPGDRAEIYGPSVSREAGNGIPMTVYRILPAGFTKVSSLGVEQQRVLVILRFDNASERSVAETFGLGVDYRTQVRIYTAENQNALIVPRSSIFRDDAGNWQLFIADGNRARRAVVEVGIVNDHQAEVLKGLTSDATVLIAPPASLEEGAKIQPLP